MIQNIPVPIGYFLVDFISPSLFAFCAVKVTGKICYSTGITARLATAARSRAARARARPGARGRRARTAARRSRAPRRRARPPAPAG
uniref:Uncharacterized protein n=1 Tax=Pararge aegeria TaxID=116150 RepID=S4P9B5_9NEOP